MGVLRCPRRHGRRQGQQGRDHNPDGVEIDGPVPARGGARRRSAPCPRAEADTGSGAAQAFALLSAVGGACGEPIQTRPAVSLPLPGGMISSKLPEMQGWWHNERTLGTRSLRGFGGASRDRAGHPGRATAPTSARIRPRVPRGGLSPDIAQARERRSYGFARRLRQGRLDPRPLPGRPACGQPRERSPGRFHRDQPPSQPWASPARREPR